MAGQYFDVETGLHYNYHRYYDPSIGRYLRPDPIGLAGGINLFSYASNNPINLIDPYGLSWLEWRGFDYLEPVGNFAAGFGDRLTSGFGLFDTSLTELAREYTFANDVVDKCSDTYRGGVIAGEVWGVAFGTASGARYAGWTVSFNKYPSGGGGVNILRNNARRLGLDWHKFKLNGRMTNRLHYHRGATKSQMKKHRPWQGRW